MPVVSDDKNLTRVLSQAEIQKRGLLEVARKVLHDVADRYRIHRRILRNRRTRLVEEGKLVAIERVLLPIAYLPDPREHEATKAAHRLIVEAKANGLEDAILLPFARALVQAACDPATLVEVVEELDAVDPKKLSDKGRDLIEHGHHVGPSDWGDYLFLLCQGAKHAVPAAAMARAVDATSAWKRSKHTPARRSAVIKYLKGRKASAERGPKVVLFAGYQGVADPLATALSEEFGEDAVARFLSDMGQEDKERAVIRFRDHPRCWILVCDESGGEGRNFQFASELLHYDTPWHIARLEQRIGRLDRMGREEFSKQVESVAVFAKGTPEEGYVTCASEGIGVYTKSVSGLEFGLRDIEVAIATAATDEDPLEAMRGLLPELRQRSTDERSRDDGDAVLDEASYERRTAERYLRLSHDRRAEADLETSFVNFFECLAPRGVSRGSDDSGNPVVRFDTHRLVADAIALPEQAAAGDGRFKGTFNRAVAQRAPGIQFFQAGNPLFDAVLRSAKAMPAGRCYAVECKAPNVAAWRGFEFAFKPAPAPGAIDDMPSLALRAASVMDTVPLHVFVDGNGVVASDKLLEVRSGLAPDQKGVSWSDLIRERAALLVGAFRRPWADVLASAGEVALAHAKNGLAEKLSDALSREMVFLDELERGIDATSGPEESQRMDQLRRYRKALNEWEPVLDSLGFLLRQQPAPLGGTWTTST